MLEWTWGKPLLQNFSNYPQKGYIETEPDAGVPFRRLMFTDICDYAICNFDLTRGEYVRFMDWYKTDLRQGTMPFKFFDCRYKAERTARIVGDVPQYTTNSNRYNMSVTLAFMPDVISYDFVLLANDDRRLIVNEDNPLVAGVTLRA